MNIKGKRVNIRAIEEKDLEIMWEAINSDELERMENGFNFPISFRDQKTWYEENGRPTFTNAKLIIEFEGKVIGYTNILNIDWKNRVAHTGIKIFNQEFRNKGLGKDSVMAIMRFCFEELNLNRLESCIIEYNTPSRVLYIDKCGWKVEGIKREHVYKNGCYHNLLMIGILKSEYYALVENSNYWKEETE